MGLTGYLGNEVDLDTGTERNLRHPERASGVLSFISENLHQQFRSAISNKVLLSKRRRAIHQHHHLQNAMDFVQVPQRGLKCPQQLDGYSPCRGFSLLCNELTAQLSRPRFAVRFGDVT